MAFREGSDVGRLNHVEIDGVNGYPLTAYYDETNDAIKMAFDNGGWQLQTAVPTAGGVLDLALQLGLDSRSQARIAYVTSSGELNLAILKKGVWLVENTLEGLVGPSEISLLGDRAHMAFSDQGALYDAFRSDSLEGFITDGYSPVWHCPEISPPGMNGVAIFGDWQPGRILSRKRALWEISQSLKE